MRNGQAEFAGGREVVTAAPVHAAAAVNATSAAIETRLLPFRSQVQRHILAIVKDQAEADELAQDTYARALERSAQLRDPQAALAWLYRIATTVTLDRLRQRRPSTVPLDDQVSAAACTFELDERGVLVCDPQPERRTEEAR